MISQKALFLDRDGVINHDYGYVHRPDNFHFLDGIFAVCQLASSKGYKIIIVTNQSGIARGFYKMDDFLLLNDWMIAQFNKHNISIHATYFCPHHSEGIVSEFRAKCDCRKPEIGLFLRAKKDHNIDIVNSIIIGDKETDILAGKKAGIRTRILLSSEQKTVNENVSFHCLNYEELLKLKLFS